MWLRTFGGGAFTASCHLGKENLKTLQLLALQLDSSHLPPSLAAGGRSSLRG